jgi:hypothetical protein
LPEMVKAEAVMATRLSEQQYAKWKDQRDFLLREQESKNRTENLALDNKRADAQLGLSRRQVELAERQEGVKNTTSELREYEVAKTQGFQGNFLDYKKAIAESQRAQTIINNNPLPKPPAGFRYNADGTTLEAIPGGPGEQITGEVGARLGLGKVFLDELPGIKKDVKEGALTGPLDRAQVMMGVGKPGEVARKIASGTDALLRNLTGAGMSEIEARRYAKRYEPQMQDGIDTILSKLDQLEKELRTTGEIVGRGRGGNVMGTAPTAPAPPQAAPSREQIRQELLRRGHKVD